MTNNLPVIAIVGSASKVIQESKDRLRGAYASSGLQLPRKRITINLAPAALPKADSGIDAAIAASIMCAVEPKLQLSTSTAIVGELGLDGSVRPVRGIIGKLLAARAASITTCLVPVANLHQARLVSGIKVVPIAQLLDIKRYLAGTYKAVPDSKPQDLSDNNSSITSIDDIVGQSFAKRALVIAAAGGHHVFLSGPPGTGKSLLAQALPSLLPKLSINAALEATQLQSLTAPTRSLVQRAPFRSPHHTSSHIALLGSPFMPGEISLSHHGVLLLDEFPEFNRQAIESLRQPLEERRVTVTRLAQQATYPASCLVVATANPCPCGYADTPERCSCSPVDIQRYLRKLSGPIIDRIGLFCKVNNTVHEGLLNIQPTHDATRFQQQITLARRLQRRRYNSSTQLNAHAGARRLSKTAQLSDEARDILAQAAATLSLSSRSYLHCIRIARTIADLDGSSDIRLEHITEAVAYRKTPRASLTSGD